MHPITAIICTVLCQVYGCIIYKSFEELYNEISGCQHLYIVVCICMHIGSVDHSNSFSAIVGVYKSEHAYYDTHTSVYRSLVIIAL